ncbi:MAG: T9SS type A sorting domain-containing protein [Candidatus Zixiibacteriota bacterium]
MRRTLTAIIVFALTLGITDAVVAQLPYNGVVTVDSARAKPTESVAVNVWLRNNDIAISAITLPLKFSSSALTLDSVSLGGTIWSPDFSGYYVIDNTARTARITVLPNDMVYPLPSLSFTNGIVAVLHFRVATSATPQRVAIDSIYADSLLGSNIHIYTRIDVADNTGTGVYLPDFTPGYVEVLLPTGVDDETGNGLLPTEFALDQNYPNPFNPTTIIRYALPRAGSVRLQVFNILGQEVALLFEGHRDPGVYTYEFDGGKLPSGIYFYRLSHDGGTATRKMMLVK